MASRRRTRSATMASAGMRTSTRSSRSRSRRRWRCATCWMPARRGRRAISIRRVARRGGIFDTRSDVAASTSQRAVAASAPRVRGGSSSSSSSNSSSSGSGSSGSNNGYGGNIGNGYGNGNGGNGGSGSYVYGNHGGNYDGGNYSGGVNGSASDGASELAADTVEGSLQFVKALFSDPASGVSLADSPLLAAWFSKAVSLATTTWASPAAPAAPSSHIGMHRHHHGQQHHHNHHGQHPHLRPHQHHRPQPVKRMLVWDAFVASAGDGLGSDLVVRLPEMPRLDDAEFRDMLIVLTELAEEILGCDRLFVAVERAQPDASDVTRALMYSGFELVPPGYLAVPHNSASFILLCQNI
ncbi:hypothetical protein GQ42DRAFT_86222 [Ramicandelaber brevisporus]|nr:hypothetical protein GQ42DRAFT_86222 [Ramicandelaber brevisporus]